MPMDKKRYPIQWQAIANNVKNKAEWKCQKCGKQCRKPGEKFDTHKNTLRVVDLNHFSDNVTEENLIAMCASCYFRYDAQYLEKERMTKHMMRKQNVEIASSLQVLINNRPRGESSRLAYALGVSRATISIWLNGRGQQTPSLDNLCRLADYYGVTTDFLLGRTSHKVEEKDCPYDSEETIVHCNLKENAELIAKILDADVDNEVYENMMDDLISRQAASMELSTMLKECFSVDDEIIDAVHTTLQEIPPAPRWIPVTERLPEKDGSYLVFGECEPAFFISNFDAGCGAFGEWVDKYDLGTAEYVGIAFYKQDYVLAWMPLPEPYKEVKND